MNDETIPTQTVICANCGRTETRPGVRLCPNCGAALVSSPPTPDTAPPGGGQTQAQLERPQPPVTGPPRQPWAVTPDGSPDDQQQRRIAENGKRGGCTTAILWLVGGLFAFGLLIILGLLALCGVFKI